ncbi:MAG: GH3 auxin-responsive promoter family protein, partial [Planctomycetes bacterium]|nr:GH3 auxin-responsive promoter family protein [Planctomycetota bacterium]
EIEPEYNTAITPTLLSHELEIGKRYRMIITTSGGLYRYDLADVVEVTDFLEATPVVVFLHKAGKVLSITGEKVTEEQVVCAMQAVEMEFPELLECFTITLRLGEPPRYLLALEPRRESLAGDQEIVMRLAKSFDQHLGRKNLEYEEKRKSGRLALPDILVLKCGVYANWRRKMVAEGRPDGQLKPPHLVLNETELQGIRAATTLDNKSLE